MSLYCVQHKAKHKYSKHIAIVRLVDKAQETGSLDIQNDLKLRQSSLNPSFTVPPAFFTFFPCALLVSTLGSCRTK